jgi:hypothetical protein
MSARIKGKKPRPCGRAPGLPSEVRVTVVSACHPRDSKRPPRKILLARRGLPACNLESTTPVQKKTAPGGSPEAALRSPLKGLGGLPALSCRGFNVSRLPLFPKREVRQLAGRPDSGAGVSKFPSAQFQMFENSLGNRKSLLLGYSKSQGSSPFWASPRRTRARSALTSVATASLALSKSFQTWTATKPTRT